MSATLKLHLIVAFIKSIKRYKMNRAHDSCLSKIFFNFYFLSWVYYVTFLESVSNCYYKHKRREKCLYKRIRFIAGWIL